MLLKLNRNSCYPYYIIFRNFHQRKRKIIRVFTTHILEKLYNNSISHKRKNALSEGSEDMITLFYSPSCMSCRKARAWLKEHSIEFQERNIFSEPLEPIELRKLLMMTENGTEDLISERSKVFKKLSIDFDDLPMDDLLKLVQENPSLLRRPLITDGKRLLIGFNEEEIRVFLPRGLKRLEQREARMRAGI